MEKLALYADYDRRETHDIFAPGTPFTEGSGTWGNHGVVQIPGRPGDWVFFVTFGQTVGTHAFDEGVSADGVLTWQSQPSQVFAEKRIKEWIKHDELKHSIYLFLRARKGAHYTYLGKLKYLSHDSERENPVYFNWQILDWQMDEPTRVKTGLEYNDAPEVPGPTDSRPIEGLREIDPPSRREGMGETTRKFRAKKADFSASDARNKALGFNGEKSVICFERGRLADTEAKSLISEIRHVAEIEGDGAGYDILSFDPDGTPLYIEVKTTRGHERSDFYLSANELAFFNAHRAQYAIYRICEFEPATGSGKLFILRGEEIANLSLEPMSFRARR
ncbi:DUF3427 domain-containing protein [Rhizobium jaguaris]|uniref:DUF3427 domain-containing protein n=1 Tax=Rhizobium jaguaris TaxID=1312183 RepID=A0A387FW99_9HYPH|nr:DUF3883 domain-containing protein [Rhizobium jaguaris]AYG60434.1 DUF3427 domain-containing protein [Rhizobium jaguaris]